MAESETNVAEGSAAFTESFNSVGDVLNEDGLAAAVEDFVQPQEPDSEPEPPAQVESEEHGEPENDLSQVEEVGEEQSSNVQKRIDKLTRQRKEAEADADTYRQELAAMREELAELRDSRSEPAPSQDNPYANKTTVRELERAEEEAEDWLEWCEDNPDGGDRGGREYDIDDIKQIRRAARKALRTHIPKQKEYIEAARSYDPIANDVYPFWKKPVSAEFKVAQEFVRSVPGIKQFPDYKIIIGDYLYGRYMREQAINKKSAPAPAKKAPPQPAVSAAPKAEKSADRARQSSLNAFHQSEGSVNDLASVLGSIGLVK